MRDDWRLLIVLMIGWVAFVLVSVALMHAGV
jgi:hypothetical protein